jgi:hypothetical protein
MEDEAVQKVELIRVSRQLALSRLAYDKKQEYVPVATEKYEDTMTMTFDLVLKY